MQATSTHYERQSPFRSEG